MACTLNIHGKQSPSFTSSHTITSNTVTLSSRRTVDPVCLWAANNMSPRLEHGNLGQAQLLENGNQKFIPITSMAKSVLLSGVGYPGHPTAKGASHREVAWQQQGCKTISRSAGAVRRPLSRRRSVKELARAYYCPHDRCDRRYEAWRSLQAHLYAKHGERKRKTDYPQFDLLHIRGVTGLAPTAACKNTLGKKDSSRSELLTPSPPLERFTGSCSSAELSSSETMSPVEPDRQDLASFLSGESLAALRTQSSVVATSLPLQSCVQSPRSLSEDEIERLVQSILNENVLGAAARVA